MPWLISSATDMNEHLMSIVLLSLVFFLLALVFVFLVALSYLMAAACMFDSGILMSSHHFRPMIGAMYGHSERWTFRIHGIFVCILSVYTSMYASLFAPQFYNHYAPTCSNLIQVLRNNRYRGMRQIYKFD
ncbi:uncharacterized protein EV420DRAFT_156224 [Desarmillaria tabescens]|uniref:Uncharacterized protein n=1 Tax=Armillaria tabescens TaxID=1929756 RepID=A0AA39J814_ARMTA|nr:uncharacterized protein EV420DRAFT_156224 [Desarmillaria tabescens]KAK0437753.1 hypothetical protein EV420DRAFT_156224 [Desarmillaria tabescens]